MLSIIEKSLFEGYATNEIRTSTIFMCMFFTSILATYIFLLYKKLNKNSFYDRSFHISLFALSIITAAIILTIQSNIVVSLGMVGALSIVRFRTAIKNPMDLVFLFWSISAGIICGAGFAIIGIVASLILTAGIIVFSVLPSEKETLILVINADSFIEPELAPILDKECLSWKVRARNISQNQTNLAIEVKLLNPEALIQTLNTLENITSISLVEHDGDVAI